MFGLGLGVSKVATKGVGGDVPAGSDGAFDPASLFASNEKGFFYDINDLSTVYEDTAGTTLQATAGGRVGKILDKSGNNKHAVAISDSARGILLEYPENGTKNYMRYSNETFASNTGWSVFATVATDNNITVPDLNINPQKITSTSGGTTLLTSASAQHKHSVTTCLSFYLKLGQTAGTSGDCNGVLLQNAGRTGFLYVDVERQIVVPSGGLQTTVNETWTNKGNGWYLLEIPLDAAGSDLQRNTLSFYFVEFSNSNTLGSLNTSPNQGSGLYLSGIQFNDGSTRGADYQKHHNQYKITQSGKSSRYAETGGKYETELAGDANSAEVTATMGLHFYTVTHLIRNFYRFHKNVSNNELFTLGYESHTLYSLSHPNASIGSASQIQSNDVAGKNYVTTQNIDLSTGSHVLRINGAQEGTSTINTGGVTNFGGNIFELRSGEYTSAGGDIFALCVIYRELTTTELDNLEQYMADRMVITI